jgi:hypothetical protein
MNRFGSDRVKKFPGGHMSLFNAETDSQYSMEFHGIPGHAVLPKGCKFNSSYYQSEVLELLSEWRNGQAGAAG